MYKQYRHKLNLLEPGGKMIKAIGILLLVAVICNFMQLYFVRTAVLVVAGIIVIVLIILLIVEQRQDRILNAQAIHIDAIIDAGIHKKSFILNFNGGEIWCEHLDSMGEYKEKVLEKFAHDEKQFNQIHMPTHMAINLDETRVDEEILETIVTTLTNTKQTIRKVAFIGLSKTNQRLLKKIQDKKNVQYVSACINDYEKAKEWIFLN